MFPYWTKGNQPKRTRKLSLRPTDIISYYLTRWYTDESDAIWWSTQSSQHIAEGNNGMSDVSYPPLSTQPPKDIYPSPVYAVIYKMYRRWGHPIKRLPSKHMHQYHPHPFDWIIIWLYISSQFLWSSSPTIDSTTKILTQIMPWQPENERLYIGPLSPSNPSTVMQ